MKKRKLNNKINQSINIVESILLLLLITIGLVLYNTSLNLPSIVQTIIIGFSILLIASIISIEMFCLMIENNKNRIYSILYYVGTAAILLIINDFIPFFAIISLLVLNITKNIYRIKNIDTIYEYDKFAAYCKIYNIKTSKARGRKKSTSTKKATAVAVKNTVKEPAKKTSKSYA